MARGILDTLGLAGSVLFAAPAALFGAQKLIEGDVPLGVAFLVLAALMILVPRVAKTPDDVAVGAAERAAGAVVRDDEDGE